MSTKLGKSRYKKDEGGHFFSTKAEHLRFEPSAANLADAKDGALGRELTCEGRREGPHEKEKQCRSQTLALPFSR
eukprot:883693-Pyramimonas_sp.AAC.1